MFTQRNEESESEVDVDDFNFDDELESDEVAYGYQFVQRFPAQQNYVEDMRGNGRYYLNMGRGTSLSGSRLSCQTLDAA